MEDILFCILFFKTEVLYMNCALCESYKRKGWNRIHRDQPNCYFPSTARLKVCNKELNHCLGFPPILGSIEKKKIPYSQVTTSRNGFLLMLLPRGHAHYWPPLIPNYFYKLSLQRLRQVPCACPWLPGSHYRDKPGIIITKTHLALVSESWD